MDKKNSRLNFYRATSIIFTFLFVGVVALNYTLAWTNPSQTPPNGGAGAIPIASGGTGATTASGALSALGAASSGANSNITSLTGLTTPLSVAQGGTGANTITGVLLGNGTSAVTAVSPGTSGNVLTSNGTAWASSAPAGGGKFGGTGADGALNISSGTTTLALGGASTFVKNYTSISITGTGQLAFSGPNANGTTIILKSQGNVTITSSTVPAIDVRNMGASGGSGGTGGSTTQGCNGAGGGAGISSSAGDGSNYNNSANGGQAYGSPGSNSIGLYTLPSGRPGGVSNGTGGVTIGGNLSVGLYANALPFQPGAGGGGGGGCNNGSGGAGGRGGGALYIQSGGALNISSTIDASGGAGGAAGNGSSSPGGGGGGGVIVILYNTLTANTGTYTVTSGSGGSGGYAPSGSGGNGASLVTQNTEF